MNVMIPLVTAPEMAQAMYLRHGLEEALRKADDYADAQLRAREDELHDYWARVAAFLREGVQ